MSDPKEIKSDFAEQTRGIRAEYEAEFEPEESKALTKADVLDMVTTLTTPSARQVIKRLEIEYRKKLGEAESEVAEMLEREVYLKEQNRTASEHAKRLATERDEALKLVDPDGVIRSLRERAVRAETLYEGALKEIEKLKGKLAPKKPKRATAKRKARKIR